MPFASSPLSAHFLSFVIVTRDRRRCHVLACSVPSAPAALALALLLQEERLIELLPNADGFVVRAGDDELAVVADGKRPDFAVMTLELLDVFELETPR